VPNPKLGTERNGMEFRGKKLVLRNRTFSGTCIEVCGGEAGELCTNVLEYTLKLGKVLRNSRKHNYLSVHLKSSIRLPRFVLSWFLFRGMVRNGIPRICIYFGSTERNSELCSLPQKDSEQNNGSLLLFLFHGTDFRVVFSFAEGFGTEFRDFLFRGTTGIPSEITICSVYSVFRGIIFLSEIPNPI
jgi:hypothetical protein